LFSSPLAHGHAVKSGDKIKTERDAAGEVVAESLASAKERNPRQGTVSASLIFSLQNTPPSVNFNKLKSPEPEASRILCQHL